MPAVFAQAGWLLGLIILTVLCVISFIQLTFLVETMANANFASQMDKMNQPAMIEANGPLPSLTKDQSMVSENEEEKKKKLHLENSTESEQGGKATTDVAMLASTTQANPSTKSDTSKLVNFDMIFFPSTISLNLAT